jgi:membrane protein involved in colicin uptake
MKRFALVTCLAACLVFALGVAAFGADQVTVGTAAGGGGANVTVGVFVDNDASIKTFVLPLVIRD